MIDITNLYCFHLMGCVSNHQKTKQGNLPSLNQNYNNDLLQSNIICRTSFLLQTAKQQKKSDEEQEQDQDYFLRNSQVSSTIINNKKPSRQSLAKLSKGENIISTIEQEISHSKVSISNAKAGVEMIIPKRRAGPLLTSIVCYNRGLFF